MAEDIRGIKESEGGEGGVGSPVTTTPPYYSSQDKILGQTKAAWYIYWICGVAPIANM